MRIENINDLFVDMLKDVYSAEEQMLEALPKMAEKVSNDQLKSAIQNHIQVTEQQKQRLEKVGDILNLDLSGEHCEAMEGNVEEAEELMENVKDQKVLDAAVIAAAQKAEHYEIATYGTLTTLAKDLGQQEVANLLHETLQEEKSADDELTQIAKSRVNERAEQTS